ncbi:MAG: hypothetical protein GY801_07900, partial [bacterium]|nr:hypothetical protein [bacterium]
HYNAQDRVVKVDDVNGNTVSEYFYDPFGRRLWKEVGGTRTFFFYADEGLVSEYDAAGNEIRAYGYRPDSIWTTDPLWLKQGGEYYFYQNDHLGTPQKLVRQNGAVVWSASYSAFGQARMEVETVTNNLRFPGQYFDAETELHYNWHRYYASVTGRYLRSDPLDLNGWAVNLYHYAFGNPVNMIDPKGLWPWTPGSWFNPTCHNFTKSPGLDGKTHAYGEKYKAVMGNQGCSERLFPGRCRPALPDNREKWFQNGNCEEGTLRSASYADCRCVATCWLSIGTSELETSVGFTLTKLTLKKMAKAAAIAGKIGKISSYASGIGLIWCVVDCSV